MERAEININGNVFIGALLLGIVAGGFVFGTIGYMGGHMNGATDARFAERERDLKVLFTKFEECEQDDACENLYRNAYFALRLDQQTRDGRDALERIYKQRPYLRPVPVEELK